MDTVSFRFDDAAIQARDGQSVAAALIEAGIRGFRRTASGASRGMFCGMGVCQDCLVQVEGVANRRACMTRVTAGLDVRSQVALPDLAAGPPLESPPACRRERPDLLVIGGGAAGLNAAIAACTAGASTLLIDERPVPGGQYYKQSAAGLPCLDRQQREGNDLVRRARAAGVRLMQGAELWGAFDGPVFYADHENTVLVIEPKLAIVATGAYERPVMVPGWDLPGVMTTGAAQTLWRSYRTLPGRRIAVVGSGPLNLQVALELMDGGAEIRLLADTAVHPWRRPWAGLAMLAADPGQAARGAAMLRRLGAGGVRLRSAARLERIEPAANGLAVAVRGPAGATTTEVDVVCMNGGFQPQNEVLRLLGARMTYDALMHQLRVERDGDMQTSVDGLYAVGDCCGLGGAAAAIEEGAIAGAAVARRLGKGDARVDLPACRRRLARHRRFQSRLWSLFDPAATLPADGDPATMVCRCEEVRLGDIDAVIADGQCEIGSIKRATRLGMGRCQGRYCAPTLALHLSRHTGKPVGDLSFFAPRTPIKPVAIASVTAACEAPGAP